MVLRRAARFIKIDYRQTTSVATFDHPRSA